MGFERPTEIQERVLPVILGRRDLIASAQTGTGKTAAFLLPIISLLNEGMLGNGAVGSRVLVLAPTRELAMQIDQQVEGLGYFTAVTSRAVYGGSDGRQWSIQREAIESGADILVATPGRLIQFLQLGINPLGGIEIVVLDEADRMLDMGFLPDITRILEYLPARRQSLLFSATMPKEIVSLSRRMLRDPVSVNIALSQPARGIEQHKAYVREADRVDVLARYLAQRPELRSVIVFAERKVTVRELHRRLLRRGISAVAIHSDLEQHEREANLSSFRARQDRVLVATDIVARGIDIDEIELVVNYDVPSSAEAYVHRIGRTARASSRGESLTLVTASGLESLAYIEQHLGASIPLLPLEGAVDAQQVEEEAKALKRTAPPRGGRSGKGRGGAKGRSAAGRSKAAPTSAAGSGAKGGKSRHKRRKPPSNKRDSQ